MTVTDRAQPTGVEVERYWRNTLYAVFAVTVARLVWLALGKADLYPDEAQYWVWSLHPAFGYYSKPPLVAWLIALTTGLLGDGELAVRVAAPLLHFGTALVLFAVARRLYDARIAAWSAVVYATLPGVSASAIIMSTDAPLLLCWTIALYAFLRAREDGAWRWWAAVGVAAGFGLLAKYAMAYWLVSALLFLLVFRAERRHLPRFFAAAALALAIYAPNFFWNLAHGWVSYHHTEDNAAFHGVMFHPGHLLEFFGSQFGVFGPVPFAALIAIVAQGRRVLKAPNAALLAMFALPTLAMMLVVSMLSRAEPNWAAPTYVSATVLVVAWLIECGWWWAVAGSVALHVALAAAVLEAHDMAAAFGYELPAKYDILHRLRGYRRLGVAVGRLLREHPGAVLLAENREDMAALLYYVRPHPFNALKWNGGDNLVHDQFDLDAKPQSYIGDNFLLVSPNPDIAHIISRFASAGPIEHIIIPIGGGESRHYIVRYLEGFEGYR
ncbi:MAG TPA: glycosyltransferase family 39 protein [Stellaceae bacterium]|nr:glycosyltransferase family 39 protein [Stellaceae bacterium]